MALIEKCNLQLQINDVFECAQTGVELNTDQIVLSQAMYDQNNLFKLQSLLLNERGQTQNLQLIWDEPDCNEAEDGCALDACTEGGGPSGQLSQNYTLTCSDDNSARLKMTFDLNDYRKMMALDPNISGLGMPTAEATNEWGRQILKMIAKIDKKLDAKLAAKLVSLVDTTTFGFAQVEGLDPADLAADKGKWVRTHGVVGPEGIRDLSYQVRKSANAANFCQMPLILGYDLIEEYLVMNSAHCCNYDGYNMAGAFQANQMPFIKSLNIAKELALLNGGGAYGTPWFLSMNLGDFQLLNFERFSGIFSYRDERHLKDVITSPYTGRRMNLTINLEPCNMKVTVAIGSTEELIQAPETRCDGYDSWGSNGLQQFVIKNCQ